MSVLERPLDTIEAVFAAGARLHTCGAAILVGVSGALTAETCARALASIPARHPRFRTRVVREGTSFAFTSDGAAPLPLRVVAPTARKDWARLLEDELHRRLDDSLPSLLGATFAPSREPGESHALVVWAQHAAIDFLSLLNVAQDILAACAAIASGAEIPSLPLREAAAPLDARLPPLPDHAASSPAPAAEPATVMVPFDGRAPMLDRHQRLLLHVVPARTCRALLDRGRRVGTTLTGIVTAAALEAIRRTWGPLPAVRVGTSVSARALCVPPVPSEEIGCFVSQLETVHALGSPVSLWEHARAHSADIRRRIEGGEWHARIRALSGNFDGFERQVVALAHDEGTQGRTTTLDIVSLGALSLADVPPLRLGPLYAGISNQGIGNCLWLAFGSLDDELHCSLGYVSPLVNDAHAQGFLDALDRLLEQADDDDVDEVPVHTVT